MSATQPAPYAGPRDRLCYYCATRRPHFDAEHRRHVNQEIGRRCRFAFRAGVALVAVHLVLAVCWVAAVLTIPPHMPRYYRGGVDLAFASLGIQVALIGGAVFALIAAWNLAPIWLRRRLPDSEKAR